MAGAEESDREGKVLLLACGTLVDADHLPACIPADDKPITLR